MVLTKEYRGSVLENDHHGRICIMDYSGKIIYSLGNVGALTYYRSTSKPIQILPTLCYGLDQRYHLEGQEIAVMASSHAGEDIHLKALLSIMDKIGVTEQELIMLPTYPAKEVDKNRMIEQHLPPRKVLHNCSGKHLSLMMLARHIGNYAPCAHKNYWQIDCPAQKEVRQIVSQMSSYPYNKIRIGVDGCGVPVFAVPMPNMCLSYLRLACPELVEDSSVRKQVEKITHLFNMYPDYTSGTNDLTSVLNADFNIMAKNGAQGVYCFALKKEKISVAIKMEDSLARSWTFVVAEILRQLNYSNKQTIQNIDNLASPIIYNDNQIEVGITKTCFNINK
ncbi:MAG: asparaginase [Clostridia bacterium]